MEAISGVFESRKDAERAIDELRKAGIPDNRIGLITPSTNSDELEAGLPVTDTERPGMGKAMGAAVGGAMGAAGGATLGLAAASLAVPGVGPLLAFGMVGAALLGVVGATAGAAATKRRDRGRRPSAHLSKLHSVRKQVTLLERAVHRFGARPRARRK